MLIISFTEAGRKSDCTTGKTWGLHLYTTGYKPMLLFTLHSTSSPILTAIGPNKVLAPIAPPPQRPTQLPLRTTHSQTIETFISVTSNLCLPIPPRVSSPRDSLLQVLQQSFLFLNATNPNATKSFWLCYTTAPTYYERIAFLGSFSSSRDPTSCR